MNTITHEESKQKKADRLRLEAGDEGDAKKYRRAEDLYRQLGDDQKADACSNAAQILEE